MNENPHQNNNKKILYEWDGSLYRIILSSPRVIIKDKKKRSYLMKTSKKECDDS
jgi:hypothetical protein